MAVCSTFLARDEVGNAMTKTAIRAVKTRGAGCCMLRPVATAVA